MHKKCVLGLIGAAAASALSSFAFAGPYSGIITETGGTVTFRLSENADDVTIIRDGVEQSLGALSRGSVSFARNGAANYRIRATKNTLFGYQDVIDANIVDGVQLGLVGFNNQITDDAQTIVQFERPVGLAVNKNAATPSLFGRIYVANPRAQATGTGRPMNDGIYVIDPDLTDPLGQGNTALTGGIAFSTASASSPFQLDLDRDGNLYIGDWSDQVGTVWRTDANVANGVNLLVGTGGTTPFIPTSTNNHGSVAGFGVKGSLSAGNLELFTLAEDLSFDGTVNGVQGLWKYDVGSTSASFAGIPTPKANPMLKVQGVRAFLEIGPTGLLYPVQLRANGGEAGLHVVSSDGNTVLYDSLADSVLLNQDSIPLGTGTFAGVQDALRGSVSAAVSPDNRWIAVADALVGDVALVPLIDGIPDILNRIKIDAFVGASNDTVEFDAAGNLYVGNRTDEILRVFSPGGVNVTEYNSAGQFTYRNEPDFNSSGNYSDPTKWLAGVVPNAADGFATIGNLSSGAQTLTLDAPVSLGRLRLAGGNYTVAGTSTLTMGAGFSFPRIIAESGDHTIAAPLSVQKDVGYGANAGANLTISSPQYATSTISITKWGGGQVTHPSISQDRVIIRDGTLRIAAGSGTSKVKSLLFAGTQSYSYGGGTVTVTQGTRGKLDITNNGFVVDYDSGSPIAALRAEVIKGRNGGTWDGTSGISSSTTAANSGVSAVGIAEAADLGIGTFMGVAVDATAVVFRHTRLGDANLDGITNIGDFSLLAANFNTASVWSKGDFNYDGLTNIGDFSLLAANFNQSAGDLPRGAAVPEPASFGLAFAALALTRRRR